jgi:hypothetical protein
MAKIQFRDTVYREGEIPLVDEAPPADPEPPVPSVRPLLWIGVLGCIVAGAWLCGALWRWQSPGTPICAGAWVALCLLAVVRAWRKAR